MKGTVLVSNLSIAAKGPLSPDLYAETKRRLVANAET
jgi:hypothetical protein